MSLQTHKTQEEMFDLQCFYHFQGPERFLPEASYFSQSFFEYEHIF